MFQVIISPCHTGEAPRLARQALRYVLDHWDPRGHPIESPVGGMVTLVARVTATGLGSCHDRVEYDSSMLQLLEPSDTRDLGRGTFSRDSVWRFMVLEAGTTHVRLFAEGNSEVQAIEVEVRGR